MQGFGYKTTIPILDCPVSAGIADRVSHKSAFPRFGLHRTVGLGSTDRYRSATPERFRTQLEQIEPAPLQKTISRQSDPH
jgi:hypothetical protein